MAHEYMHTYLHLSGYKLAPATEEGLCQLVALLWLEQAGPALVASAPPPHVEHERRLATFCAQEIRTHTSLVYGDGFRRAFARYQGSCGARLNLVLEHVRVCGSL